MTDLTEKIIDVEMQAAFYEKALENGDLEWDDEIIQYFLPVVLHFTNFNWLKLIAQHNLVEEDEVIVTNFLEMVQSLLKVNEALLEREIINKFKKLLEDL